MKKENNATRETIRGAKDLTIEPITIPEWGVAGYLRALDGEARFRLSSIAAASSDDRNVYMIEAYVCEGLLDSNQELIYDASQLEDRAELAKKNPDVVQRIYERIKEISHMGREIEDELEKKSERVAD